MKLCHALAPLLCFAAATPAVAQSQDAAPPGAPAADPAANAQAADQAQPAEVTADIGQPTDVQADTNSDSGSGTDILSRNTITVLLDGRLVLANG
jgi:hypothetical protein